MTCFSTPRVRCLLSDFIPRLFYPGSSRETVLHEGSDPNRSSTLEPTKADMSMMSKEQPTFSTASVSAVPAKDSAPIRLHVGYLCLPIDIRL